MSTGRGATGASAGLAAAAGLRFGALRFLAAGLRLTVFFLFTPFLPAFFLALTMRSSFR